MAKYGLTFDSRKCCGCYACFLSCRDEFSGKGHVPTAAAQPDGQQWIRIEEIEHGEGTKVKVDYVAHMCRHCTEPACAKGAPEGAVTVRGDGIVFFGPDKAKGCRTVIAACAHGIVLWNEEEGIPQKCTLCAHMLDAGEKSTRCAECCPTGALVYGELPEGAEGLVHIIGLPEPFLAGDVAFADKPGEPATGVSVRLLDDTGAEYGRCETDFLGDFEFAGLEAGRVYTVAIEQAGYAPKEATIEFCSSANLGTVMLQPR